MISPVPLKRLSVCPCGYGTLRDDIHIGKIYDLDLATFMRATMSCGGCHRIQTIDCIMCDGKWIPRDLFTPLARTEEQSAEREPEKSAKA